SVANTLTPFVRPDSALAGPTQNCDWWFFDTAIVLDTAGHYAFPRQVDRDSAQWYHFMQLLREHRELQPINGLILTIGVDTLLSKGPDDFRHDAAELRKRIDEAIRELGVAFPVYILVTRCDLIAGFTEFFGCLPEATRQQALGYVNDAPSRTGTATDGRLEPIFASVVDRLRQLRLAILNGETVPAASLRQHIFCFPEEFCALQQPLSTYVEALFTGSPYQHQAFFRGLFFSSAQQEGLPFSRLRPQFRLGSQSQPLARGARAYFLHDLFAHILPRDQSLSEPTGRASRWRRLKDFFGVGVCLLFCLVALALLTQAFLGDRGIRATVDEAPCEVIDQRQRGDPLLEQAERCRQVVQALIEQNQRRVALSKLLFRRSMQAEKRLRQHYVRKFESEVRASLDTRIRQHLTAGSATIPLVFVLIKRLELINQCRSLTGCPTPIDAEMQPDYGLMLEPSSQAAPDSQRVAWLRQTYEAYLRWAPASGDILQQEQQVQADLLRRWFSSKQFALQQIIPWANQNYAPVTLQAYWQDLLPAGHGRLAMDPTIRVEGAYTPGAWKRSIHPFLRRAGDAAPDMKPLLKDFEQEYRTQYFEQWRAFLADFPRGELPWWGSHAQRQQLAMGLLQESSPYNRIIDTALVNLRPLLPTVLQLGMQAPEAAQDEAADASLIRKTQTFFAAMGKKIQEKLSSGDDDNAIVAQAEATLPAWTRSMRRYSRSESREKYLENLQQIRDELTDDVFKEHSFQLAQIGFQEGKPRKDTTHPVMQALWLIGQFQKEQGSGDASEEAFWPLLKRPVLFVWKVILEDASAFIHQSWGENVVTPSQGLSKLEQLGFLYGGQGEVQAFIDQFVKPFLLVNQSGPTQVLGEELPLPPDIMKAVQAQKRLKPYALGKAASHQVQVAATRDALIDSQTNLVEEKTEFQLACGAQQFTVNNRPPAATTVFWSFESCGEVRITIFVTCNRACVERAAAVGISVPEVSSLALTKRYPGQSGFLNFIQDFGNGWRTFGRYDFDEVEEALYQYQLRAIHVFFNVGVPPSLTQLIALMSGSVVAPTLR
ncbi:MAG: type VI secretion system protein, partial [Candidatus Tectomicrobia bacterium]|nr:type VI secretion system protein [Candidatus Tectomicrobia bacterium]